VFVDCPLEIVAHAKTVAEAMNLKINADKPADAGNCAERLSILSTEEKCESKKVHG
jgi:hypothetical protein